MVTGPVVYIKVPAPSTDSVYTEIQKAVVEEKCRAGEPIVIGAQVYDILNTQRVMDKYPNRVETDPWNRMFMGKSHRNIFGLAVGMAVLDFVKERLTRHSAVLHCAAIFNQITTNLQGIGTSNRK